MEVSIINCSTSSEVEQSRGSKVQNKTEYEVQFEIEQRRNLKNKTNIQKADQLRPYLLQLSDLITKQDIKGLMGFYVQWSTQVGFKSSQVANMVEIKMYQNHHWQTLAKVVYNMYLSLFEDCNKRQRGIKFKQPKYQFEVKPESNDSYDRIVEVLYIVDNFINNRK